MCLGRDGAARCQVLALCFCAGKYHQCVLKAVWGPCDVICQTALHEVMEQVCCTNKLLAVQARQVAAMSAPGARWGSDWLTRLGWFGICIWGERQWCDASWSLAPKFSLGSVADLTWWISKKTYCNGIFSIFGWNWWRIHFQLNPTHQDNQNIWGSLSVVNLISDVRLPNPLYKFHLPNSTQWLYSCTKQLYCSVQHLTMLGKGDKLNNQKFCSQFWVCPGWDGKWVGKSWYFRAAQSLAVE